MRHVWQTNTLGREKKNASKDNSKLSRRSFQLEEDLFFYNLAHRLRCPRVWFHFIPLYPRSCVIFLSSCFPILKSGMEGKPPRLQEVDRGFKFNARMRLVIARIFFDRAQRNLETEPEHRFVSRARTTAMKSLLIAPLLPRFIPLTI